jgi:hypothetical protein
MLLDSLSIPIELFSKTQKFEEGTLVIRPNILKIPNIRFKMARKAPALQMRGRLLCNAASISAH